MTMAQTWLNGYFFEFDDSSLYDNKSLGIQYKVVTDLATEPVDLTFFKKHTSIDFTIDDTLLPTYLKAARQELERFCQKSFGNKRMKMTALNLKTKHKLMYGPVLDIISPENTFTLLGDYITSESPSKNVEIVYDTGWGDAGLPDTIKVAICQTAAGLYAFRENVITETKYPVLMNQAKKSLMPFRSGYLL